MIELGSRVADKVTELKGVATGRCIYIDGSVSILVEYLSDGNPTSHWFNENRLEIISNAK